MRGIKPPEERADKPRIDLLKAAIGYVILALGLLFTVSSVWDVFHQGEFGHCFLLPGIVLLIIGALVTWDGLAAGVAYLAGASFGTWLGRLSCLLPAAFPVTHAFLSGFRGRDDSEAGNSDDADSSENV